MLAWKIDDSQWTLGTSRLFLKAGQLRALEELRDTGGQASQQVIKRIRQQHPVINQLMIDIGPCPLHARGLK